ncbi:hypothetical protein K466DRAFT_494954 [Polyporus arcularius HHB13444]|uniref:Uncharacterized protein n=1 Tax=Polyporus arcularius HHB13444 TaxID=1314778 RepID=A0A5C3P8W5_9APHY|nr:hypothetical protein K466DRAFT_494954 [Polyporus arcularius HHB13444]
MTSRPLQASKSRPLSAIFIGSAGSTPPALPDLPEPPSPGTSSGLPSPPATNSTGSGSVGEGSTNAGSIRHRTPSSKSNSSMSGGGSDRSSGYSKKRSSITEDDEDADENENDEDHTARLSADRRRSFPKDAPDNQAALQRVKSLTQRNRMVLDKLSSISRLGSPVPSNYSRSPLSPPTAGSSSSSATSSSRLSSSQNRPPSVATSSSIGRRREPQLSGSETERESCRHSQYSPSSDGRSTPPPTVPFPEPQGAVRQRRISAPASPGKVRTSREKAQASPRSKRVSMTPSVDDAYGRSDDEDVTAAALAAVASSRRSPTGSAGKNGRQPLPREFRDRKTSDAKPPNVEPATPHRLSSRAELGRASPSPRKNRISTSDPPGSPRRLGQSRYSTVRERELTRTHHQMRWSADLSSPSRQLPEESSESPGRRQGHRSGSSEGPSGTAGRRSLLGEGLRAAGLTKRKDEDVFTSENGQLHAPVPQRRTRSTGTTSVLASEMDSSFDSIDEGRSRLSEAAGPPYNPKTPINSGLRSRPTSGTVSRPGTSMAALHHDDAPRTAPPALRSYRSTYTLPDRHLEDVRRLSTLDRSSPFSTVRSSTAQSGVRESGSDHRRLMLESLSVFESHLSRLPPMGQTTTTTIPEVFQSAQHLVHALDKLNAMLKDGTNRALEAQIDAELADSRGGVDLPELWREVGADHRENLRVSDEVVRNMTGFLLGVGKILRDVTSGNQHFRTHSLDEEVARRMTPDISPISARDAAGRQSREARRSWEPGRETVRLSALSSLERNSTSRSRPPSSMNGSHMRSSTGTSSSEGRSVNDGNDGTPATVRQSAPISGSTSVARRLYAPRDRPEHNFASYSTENLHAGDYDPSPTPISRTAHLSFPERRSLPVSVPPSLSTLPSESLITQANAAADKLSRRKISASSNITIRPEPSPFTPSIKPSNPTTAVTTATVMSPESTTAPFPLLRSESNSSSRTNGVTFSRPTTTSVSSTLSGIQQQHERGAKSRKVSLSSAFADVSSRAAVPISSQSGSESERETRPRTISARPRASLESSRGEERPLDAVRRSLATTVSYSAARKERRRTITEVFQR